MKKWLLYIYYGVKINEKKQTRKLYQNRINKDGAITVMLNRVQWNRQITIQNYEYIIQQ